MASSPMQMPFMTSNNSNKKQQQISSAASMAAMRPGEHGLRCPRCDSANTKFCYYNNYSLTQPRHFCKTCRRYWTKGGALRNVPIGGGCRKSKKSKCSSSSSSSPSLSLLPTASAAAASLLPQQFRLPYVDNYIMLSSGGGGGIASSIESLSSINQDLHWKLQQQRLQAMLYGDQQHAQNVKAAVIDENNNNNICFHHMGGDQSTTTTTTRVVAAEETSTDHNNTTAAWFLENPYSSMHNNIVSSSSHHNHNHTAANDNALSDWSGMQTWSDMHQFAAAAQLLPQGKSTHGLMS